MICWAWRSVVTGACVLRPLVHYACALGRHIAPHPSFALGVRRRCVLRACRLVAGGSGGKHLSRLGPRLLAATCSTVCNCGGAVAPCARCPRHGVPCAAARAHHGGAPDRLPATCGPDRNGKTSPPSNPSPKRAAPFGGWGRSKHDPVWYGAQARFAVILKGRMCAREHWQAGASVPLAWEGCCRMAERASACWSVCMHGEVCVLVRVRVNSADRIASGHAVGRR